MSNGLLEQLIQKSIVQLITCGVFGAQVPAVDKKYPGSHKVQLLS